MAGKGQHTGIVIVGMALALLSACAGESKLAPFASDGCSNFPNGTLEQRTLWLNCCTDHDLAYWKGGSYRDREAADEALRDCVDQAGEQEIALLMLAGVRVGGTPFLPTRFRWGYGWPWPRLYGPLSAEELQQVEKLSTEMQEGLVTP